jgi:hypothetical protein
VRSEAIAEAKAGSKRVRGAQARACTRI